MDEDGDGVAVDGEGAHDGAWVADEEVDVVAVVDGAGAYEYLADLVT